MHGVWGPPHGKGQANEEIGGKAGCTLRGMVVSWRVIITEFTDHLPVDSGTLMASEHLT